MQDTLIDNFGHQRGRGSGKSDNPTAQQFSHNDLTIATKRNIAPVTKNVTVQKRLKKDK